MKEKHGNFVDIFLLVLIGFSVFSVVGRFAQAQSATGPEEMTASVILRIEGVDTYLPSSVTEGESAFLASGERFGRITSIFASSARVRVESDGELIEGVWEDGSLWDVEVELSITGEIGENGFLRNGSSAILVGQHLSLYSERAYLYGEVIGVELSLAH